MRRGLAGKASQALRALLTRTIEFEFENIPVRLEKTPYATVWNWLRVETAITLRTRRPGGWPTFLQIEPSTRCNLSCPFCPTSHFEQAEQGNMTLDLFRRVVDDIGRHLLLIELWGWGEPFVNPAVYDMIAHAKRRGIWVVSSTNGEPFAKPSHAERLVASGLDALIVTLGGITEETNRISRAGGSLERVFAGVRNIVAEKRTRASATPWLDLTFIAMEYNEHEIPALREVARSLGVDMVNVKKMNPSSTQPDREQGDSLLPHERRLQRFAYDPVGGRRLQARHNACKVLWHCPTVRWDGRVNGCAYDFHGDYHLGHLGEAALREIWVGPRYRELRRRFRTGWTELPLCSRCTYAYEGGHYRDVFAESHRFEEDATAQPEGRR